MGDMEAWYLEEYASGLGRALRRAKYLPDRGLAVRLAESCAPLLAEPGRDRVDAVVPVPSTRRRRARRGFELAHILAQPVAAVLGVPLVRALRCRGGPPQAGLSGPARQRNLVGRIRGTHTTPNRVLLVDDMYTTGATVAACATELLGCTTSELVVATLCISRPDS